MHTRLRFHWALLPLAMVLALSGCNQQKSQSGTGVLDSQAPVAGTVQLEIDFQSDRENVDADIPCSADSTVFTILQRAQNLGDVEFKAIGTDKPESTFVRSIGGVDNLAGAGDNWVFSVNGEMGKKGAALVAVKPGDEVTWVFGKYEPK